MTDAWGGAWGTDEAVISGCVEGVCGTGGWAGALPGDPDNNSILTATAAYGGIDVAWTYPVLNPHAVSHVILYRGTSANVDLALPQRTVTGDYFYDRIAKADIREYFYWIRIVSVNGTVGEIIGPASATPMSSIAETMQDITGLIDAGALATSLRTEIERVEIINQRIYQEELDRKSQSNILTTALSEVQADGDALTALLQQEVALRISNNEALAASITTVQSELDGNLASVQTTLQTNINTVDGEVTSIGALYTAKVDVNGLIGGFGVYNDGTTVEAGFDVDRFWVGRTGPDKIKPFIIEGGVVYINEAAINKLTFSKLRDDMGSFIVEGGKVKAAYLDADNLHVKGQISVGAFNGYAWPAAGQGGAHLSASGFLIGNANGGGKYFQIASGYGTGGNAAIYTNIPAYLEDAQITNAKIADAAITTAKIGNLQVDYAKIAGNSVTVGASAAFAGSTSTICTLVLNFPVAPQGVFIYLDATVSGMEDPFAGVSISSNGTNLFAGGSTGSGYMVSTTASSAMIIDRPPAGTVTYRVHAVEGFWGFPYVEGRIFIQGAMK